MSLKQSVVHASGLATKRRPSTHKLERSELLYGIELEYEHLFPVRNHSTDPSLPEWVLMSDGSLRDNGVEFVSKPLLEREIPAALESLRGFLVAHNPRATARCGTHAHLNCLHLTVGQLLSILTTNVLIEPSLFARFAPERELSSFCVPTYFHDNWVRSAARCCDNIRRELPARPKSLNVLMATSKYSSLNCASLAKHGTLESRILPATLDFEYLQQWLGCLRSMFNYGAQYHDPLHVVEAYEGTTPQQFMEEAVGFSAEVSPRKQALAHRAAIQIAGHVEPRWDELSWDIAMETA